MRRLLDDLAILIDAREVPFGQLTLAEQEALPSAAALKLKYRPSPALLEAVARAQERGLYTRPKAHPNNLGRGRS